jgi:hypothetical protein
VLRLLWLRRLLWRHREYPDLEEEGGAAAKFKLALHCGGCMIDAQKMRARIAGWSIRSLCKQACVLVLRTMLVHS